MLSFQSSNALVAMRGAVFSLVVLAISAACAFALEVRGQEFRVQIAGEGTMFGGERQFQPAMTQRQLNRYADVLELDATQRSVAEGILDMYREDFDSQRRRVESQLRDIREEAMATGEFGVMPRKSGPIYEAWSRKRDALEKELIDSLQSLLSDEQFAHWPRFERERRRATLLPDARLGGEAIDVIVLYSELGVVADEELTAAVNEVFEQYAIEIDSALQMRDRALAPLHEQWPQSFGDPERAAAIWKEGTSKRAVVRDMNRRYMETVAGLLSEEDGARLREAWERAAFPLAFEPTRLERQIESIRDVLALSSDQQQRIEAIESEFLSRLGAIRSRLIRQILADEDEPPAFIQATVSGEGQQGIMIRAVGGEDHDAPMSQLLRDRFQLSRTYLERIEEVLSEQQRDALPETPRGTNLALPGRGFRFNL